MLEKQKENVIILPAGTPVQVMRRIGDRACWQTQEIDQPWFVVAPSLKLLTQTGGLRLGTSIDNLGNLQQREVRIEPDAVSIEDVIKVKEAVIGIEDVQQYGSRDRRLRVPKKKSYKLVPKGRDLVRGALQKRGWKLG